ncbi:MazG family protein [Frankia sp. Ag45/Mut15]|uniref:MazG family protein n=1 Tax=Frankia umida TaxID=573489 RepID=A0ABT0K081_9ACTN|nr:MazG family protein [Frankia umida]MCK9877211.1 MazG family protein [Frankia umida]
MPLRVTMIVTSPRVAPGILTAPAWDLLRQLPVLTASPAHPQLDALRAAGAAVTVITGEDSHRETADEKLAAWLSPHVPPDAARIAWLADPVAPSDLDRQLDRLAQTTPPDGDEAARDLIVDTLLATAELPGSALLDAVSVMDRLRSPGGCPWDAEQTHESLAPYLIEETYEAYQAIEDGDLDELREELGDVLMQVLFHARVAAERPEDPWDVDDVATGLAAKLIRRHPHVFADVIVDGSADVVTNWNAIKAEEKGRVSVTEGVALSQPALSLAAKLLRRASGIGVPLDVAVPVPVAATDQAVSGVEGALLSIVADVATTPLSSSDDAERAVGDLLFAAVAWARAGRVDPEQALRARARRFRDQLAAAEGAARADSAAPPDPLPAERWRTLWPSPSPPAG